MAQAHLLEPNEEECDAAGWESVSCANCGLPNWMVGEYYGKEGAHEQG